MVQVVHTIPISQIRHKKDRYPRAHTLRMLPLKDIIPSPYQHRKHFDPVKLEELAGSRIQDGMISPILVRPAGKQFELISGERLVRSVGLRPLVGPS